MGIFLVLMFQKASPFRFLFIFNKVLQYSTLGGQGAAGTTKSFLTLLFFLQRDYLRTIRGGTLQKDVLLSDTSWGARTDQLAT